MSVSSVNDAGQLSSGRSAGHMLRFDADGAFDSKLRVGEILQGKVTRHFNGSRYAVDFGGTEKIVDSDIPLTRGELIYGRVIGLSEKVQLQRVYPEQTHGFSKSRSSVPRSGNLGLLQELFSKYQAKLTPEIKAQVLPLMKGHPAPATVALGSLIISKLGLQVAPDLVRSVCKVLTGERQTLDAHMHRDAPALKTENESVLKPELHLISNIASTLSVLSEPRISQSATVERDAEAISADGNKQETFQGGLHGGGAGRDSSGSEGDEHLGRWILNAQNGGSVSHRLARLPIWFGDQLVEVDVVMFSQRDATVQNDRARHRKIVLSLQTEALGLMEVSIFAVDRRVRLHFAADSEQSSNEMATHFSDIKSAVNALGWVIDEVRYASMEQAPDGLIRAVAEHYIADDSLNRVM